MRLFMMFFSIMSLVFLLSPHDAFAQMTMGGNMWGSGMYGGMQACPYMGGGATAAGSDAYQDQIDALEEKIEALREKQEDLKSGEGSIGKVALSGPAVRGLVSLIEKDFSGELACQRNGDKTFSLPSLSSGSAQELVDSVSPDGLCRELTKKRGAYGRDVIAVLSPEALCSKNIYAPGRQPDEGGCLKWVKTYSDLESKVLSLEKEIGKLEDKRDKAEEKEYKAEIDALLGKKSSSSTYCTTCGSYVQVEPEAPGWKQILAAGAMDLLNAGVWYAGTRYVSKNNAKLGWATPPLAMGLPGANATAALFSGYLGGGMGSGSFGCSPMAGYNWGPNGAMNPYGNMSPYGACGGAFAGACGSYGYNPMMGGGIYTPGVGMGGMSGPWGGGGYFPNPFGFGMNGGMNGGFNPYGILANGINSGNMMFPGAYPYGYGVNGGFNMGLGGGGAYYGPGGMTGGYPYGGGMMGGYPYGGGMMGGYPYGGGYGVGGSPWMPNGGMNGGLPFNPYLGGLGGGLGIGGGYPGMGGIGGVGGVGGNPWMPIGGGYPYGGIGGGYGPGYGVGGIGGNGMMGYQLNSLYMQRMDIDYRIQVLLNYMNMTGGFGMGATYPGFGMGISGNINIGVGAGGAPQR